MTIWSVITLICDALKLTGIASYFWKQHVIKESTDAQAGVNRQSDSDVIRVLRDKYSRD